jgi:hypothetical protein
MKREKKLRIVHVEVFYVNEKGEKAENRARIWVLRERKGRES